MSLNVGTPGKATTESLDSWGVPTVVHGGDRALDKLPDSIRQYASSVVVVTDVGVRGTGIVDDIRRRLATSGVRSAVLEVHEPHPELETIVQFVAEVRRRRAGAVLAIGGGRSMDVAKATAAAVLEPEFLDERHSSWSGSRGLVQPETPDTVSAVPCFAIPTTIGTGSEVNPVVSVLHRGQKKLVMHPALRCRAAFLDPASTASLPMSMQLAGAFEVWSRSFGMMSESEPQLLQDALAVAICSTVIEAGRRIASGATDQFDRFALSLASAQTHTSFQHLGRRPSAHLLWYIANEIATICSTTKIAALAALTPAMVRLGDQRLWSTDRRAAVLQALPGGVEDDDPAAAVAALLRSWDLPVSLPMLGATRAHGEQAVSLVSDRWSDQVGADRLHLLAPIVDEAMAFV